jgi:hypothetical protein
MILLYLNWVRNVANTYSELFSDIDSSNFCPLPITMKVLFISDNLFRNYVLLTGATLEDILGFRKENRKRNRQFITNSPLGIKIITWTLL